MAPSTVASIGSGSGIVTGGAVGTVIVTYSFRSRLYFFC
jgi:hypothetical protein